MIVILSQTGLHMEKLVSLSLKYGMPSTPTNTLNFN